MQRVLGANTWVWTSPLKDAQLPELLAKIARMGFGAVELPVEHPGDWTVPVAAEALAEHGLQPIVVGAMAPGRDLLLDSQREATQDYLLHCVEVAQALGATRVAGPFTAETGRTWRMSADERKDAYARLRTALEPVADAAGSAGVTLAIEPLNRYETSLINTTEQALEALQGLLGPALGLLLDSYHLNIEEKSPAAAIRLAGGHLAAVQLCGTDRGAVGDDHADWEAFLDALDAVGFAGPLVLESFTAHNDTIATAASIWRPLAESQDALAERSLAYLTTLQSRRGVHHE